MPRKNTTALLKQLRILMKKKDHVPQPLHAYIISSGDAHQSEYICPSDRRREFMTGFNGSLGIAVVTDKEAALWTDGRYTLQAAQQIDENWTLMIEGVPSTPTKAKWLSKVLSEDSIIGVDPKLYNMDQWQDLHQELKSSNHTLIPVPQNLVDLVWGVEQPPKTSNSVFPLQIRYTGMSLEQKVEKVRENIKEENCMALVITALDEVAYLFNLRGTDIEYNPVFFSYAVVTMDESYLFIDEKQLTSDALDSLSSSNVTIKPYDSLIEFIEKKLSSDNGKFWIPNQSSYSLCSLVASERRMTKISPIALMKAIKNDTEIQGIESCHIRDAVALCRYFNWLEKQVPVNKITEISGADMLQKFREENEDFEGLSFETISSVGPNAAVIHYSPTPETDRLLTCDEVYLVDSGGQYRDGTTDVTRTMHFGCPDDFERECFTRVLKGVIALDSALFPEKLKGNCLDTLARKALWDVGLNYKHGTGHGVGMFLNVHEGPMGISWRQMPNDPGLQEGMFLSDEPGYYEDGKFGIRTENITRIVKANPCYKKSNYGNFLTFKTVTLVPIQTKMIDQSLLTQKEISWLNDYHSECLAKVGPLLLKKGLKDDYNWLVKATQTLG